MMLGKILKKLRVNQAAMTLLSAPVETLAGETHMTEAEALSLLCSRSPDPQGSAWCPGSLPDPSPDLDLDIIVPVYNMEGYLRDCIGSILSQETDYRFRAIFIDDGSTDHSGEILDEYRGDSRVLVIHQKNQGFSGARNAGIALAAAPYLTFVDSDDLLAPGAVQVMLSAAFSRDAALVQGCFATFRESGKYRRELDFPSPLVENPPLDTLPGYLWGKVFRRAYFDHLRLPLGYWYEDSIVYQILFPALQREEAKVVAVNDIVYDYRNNPQGISRIAQGKPKALDSFWITQALFSQRARFSLENTQWDYEAVLTMILLTYDRTARQPKGVRQALMILWDAFLRKQFPGFHTGRKSYESLERAIHHHNFPLYSLCCQLL